MEVVARAETAGEWVAPEAWAAMGRTEQRAAKQQGRTGQGLRLKWRHGTGSDFFTA